VIDLGCGIGATVRALSPLLQGPQQWLLVDHDARLLEHAPPRVGNALCRTVCLDLASELHRLPFEGCTLVTASALLDLVGMHWLQMLIAACARARAALYLSLNVDGRWQWQPAQRGDALAQRLFADHQRRDKGFGAALGPRAAAVAAAACRAAGYRVRSARSDWRLDPATEAAAAALQRRLIDGIAAAAVEQAPQHAAALRAWRDRRLDAVAGTSLRVGHVDLIALPPGP
jgi:SAM-dependent methyltransferase